jgi:GLPGLI family protein
MKKILLFLIVSLSLQSLAQMRFDYPIKDIEQVELVATYSLKFQQDSTNPAFVQQEDMLLFLGRNASKFQSRTFYQSDTIMRAISNAAEFQDFMMDRNKPFPRIQYQILKNYPKGKITYIEHIPSSTFRYEEDVDLFNWHLSADTATICGYPAQKASCYFGGRTWVAWFSPEIPFNDGPYKFNGLPGLIVKLYDTKKHYIFELESIEKPVDTIMIDIVEKDFVVTNKKDFFRAKDGFRNNIISRAKEIGLSNEAQQHAARRMEQRNNPIELKRK